MRQVLLGRDYILEAVQGTAEIENVPKYLTYVKPKGSDVAPRKFDIVCALYHSDSVGYYIWHP